MGVLAHLCMIGARACVRVLLCREGHDVLETCQNGEGYNVDFSLYGVSSVQLSTLQMCRAAHLCVCVCVCVCVSVCLSGPW